MMPGIVHPIEVRANVMMGATTMRETVFTAGRIKTILGRGDVSAHIDFANSAQRI